MRSVTSQHNIILLAPVRNVWSGVVDPKAARSSPQALYQAQQVALDPSQHVDLRAPAHEAVQTNQTHASRLTTLSTTARPSAAGRSSMTRAHERRSRSATPIGVTRNTLASNTLSCCRHVYEQRRSNHMQGFDGVRLASRHASHCDHTAVARLAAAAAGPTGQSCSSNDLSASLMVPPRQLETG